MDFQQIRDFVNPAVAQATGLQEVENLSMPVPVAYVPVQLVIDGALSLTSENPVQNKVIAVAIQNLDGRITAVEGQFAEGVTEAVNNWLAAHPEATTTVQDGAITYAKLDANLKGEVDQISELKSAIDDITGNSIIEMSESGRYINLSGTTADVNNPSTTTNHVRCGVVRCAQGDVFTVSASGGYGSRAYGFVAQDGNILRVAPELYTCDNLLLIAPANSYWFVVNDQSNPWKQSYIGKLLNMRVSETQAETENNKLIKNGSIKPTFIPSDVVWVNKSIGSNGNLSQNTDSTRAVTQNLIDVSGYNRIEWNASAIGLNDATIAMYDGAGAYIESKYVSKSPYEIPNANVAKIRIMFGGASAIDTSKLGDDIVIVKSDSIRDNIELIPLNVGAKKTIMLIGDSITQGYGSTGFVIYDTVIDGVTYSVRGNGPDYPEAGPDYQVGTYLYTTDRRIWYEALSGDGWAQKLKAYYESKFNCEVLNYGMSGIDSSDVSAFRTNLIINSNADIVVIMIGTNDRGNTTLDTFFNRLYKTGRLIIQSGKKLILMAPIPASVSNESSFTRHIEDYEHVLYKIAKLLNCKFISMYELFMDYCDLRGITIDSLLGDGLHPSDEGYDVMFKLITKELGLNRKRPGATW